MTEFSQCPRCGWPQGPLAAPQGQEYGAPDWFYDALVAGVTTTDAKEGEEDGNVRCQVVERDSGDANSGNVDLPITLDREGEEDGSLADRDNAEGLVEHDISDAARAYAENVESVTPDIAGLVERLRTEKERLVAGEADDETTGAMLEAADALERMEKARAIAIGQWEVECAENSTLRDELTAAWAELVKVRQMARVDIEKLEAENERLRAALEDAEADMRRYADDSTPERRLVSADAIRAALTGNRERAEAADAIEKLEAELERCDKARIDALNELAYGKNQLTAAKAERDAYVADLLRVQNQVLAAKAEIATLKDALSAGRAYQAENERLRAALEKIARECDALNKGPVAVKIARAALTGRGE